jgi:predicted glycoside hydrolase/deacetylase ChbG (UPF0249 family)
MLIINADDLGRDREATDSALECYRNGRITSASGMVFMEDSRRAADLARKAGIEMGLHLNLTEKFTGDCPLRISKYQDSIRCFLKSSKYTHIVYNPFLRKHFRCVFEAQLQEFSRLYGRAPSHIDGHQHMHLSTNILADAIIPAGQKVRRNFSSSTRTGNFFKRTYCRSVDRVLSRNYRLTDYFFGLTERHKRQVEQDFVQRIFSLANESKVELMTHPKNPWEWEFLLGEKFAQLLSRVPVGDHNLC